MGDTPDGDSYFGEGLGKKEKEKPVFIVAFERSIQTLQMLYLFNNNNSGGYISANYTGK